MSAPLSVGKRATKTRARNKAARAARAVDRAIEKAPAQALGQVDWKSMEKVLLVGDLAELSNEERTQYFLSLCKSLGLNPATKPFTWIVLNGKLTLYATRNCTDQLRAIHRVNVTITERGALNVAGVQLPDVYVVKSHAALPDGRTDESIGAVSIRGLVGEDLANSIMKCETKAKRRVTLSICGLSFIDESELDTVRYERPQLSEEVRRKEPPPALVAASAPPVIEAPAEIASAVPAPVPTEVPPTERSVGPSPVPAPAPTTTAPVGPRPAPVAGPLPPPRPPSGAPVGIPRMRR